MMCCVIGGPDGYGKEPVMAIEISGIKMPLDAAEADIAASAAKKLGVSPEEIQKLRVRRQSLDARRAECAVCVYAACHAA